MPKCDFNKVALLSEHFLVRAPQTIQNIGWKFSCLCHRVGQVWWPNYKRFAKYNVMLRVIQIKSVLL